MLILHAVNKSVALHTLGCKLNYSETTAIGRLMEKEGFVQKSFDEKADVYVINTCSVTDNADKECRQLVRRIQRKSPGSMVVVTGCYAQLKPQEIAAIPGVNLVLGASEKFNIATHIKELTINDPARICSCDIEDVNLFTSSHSLNERTRIFLKVQDGCDYNCSFCTIPLARGKSRSDLISNVVENVRSLSTSGAREIVLTGINLGDFGKGFTGGKQRNENFMDLVRELDKLDAVDRYRISSIEPNLLSEEIITFVAGSKRFMPHFHIPLQSGSNKILASMRRRYRKELYQERVEMIRSAMPHCCIGADVITGFPGETEDDFKETMEFLSALDVSYLHVFTYSERDNTLAVTMENSVPMETRHQRTKQLRNLSYLKLQEFTARHIGQTRQVLFESVNKNGMIEGYTDNYIRIVAPYKKEWENSITEWVI